MSSVFFEMFEDRTDFDAASQSDRYAEYLKAVKPLLAGPSEVIFADPIGPKGCSFDRRPVSWPMTLRFT